MNRSYGDKDQMKTNERMEKYVSEEERLDREIGRVLSQKACRLQPTREQTTRMKNRVHSKIKEEAMMRHWNVKRIVLTAAAVCVLGSITAIAAGRVTSSVGGSSHKDEFNSYAQVESVEEKLGFDMKVPETFSNGYAFTSGVPGHEQGLDDDGNVVKETERLSVTYHKDGKADVYLEISGQSVYDEETGNYDQTAQHGDSTLKYSCDQYRFVPENYEISEEEQKQIDEGKLYVSYGSSEVTNTECRSVLWKDDGVQYCMLSFDNDMTPEDFFQMAGEVIDME